MSSNQLVLEVWQKAETAAAAKNSLEATYPFFLLWGINVQSFNTKIRRLIERVKKLKKNKSENGTNIFMAEAFELPKSDESQVSKNLQLLPPETQSTMKLNVLMYTSNTYPERANGSK